LHSLVLLIDAARAGLLEDVMVADEILRRFVRWKLRAWT